MGRATARSYTATTSARARFSGCAHHRCIRHCLTYAIGTHKDMPGRLHTVAETPQFARDTARLGLSEDEVMVIVIVNAIAADPLQGDEVQGSGGVRKVRIAGRGRGKSGGYRLMVAFVGEEAPAYLLALLSKGQRANFTAQQVAAMRALTTVIKQMWRARRKKR